MQCSWRNVVLRADELRVVNSWCIAHCIHSIALTDILLRVIRIIMIAVGVLHVVSIALSAVSILLAAY